MPQLGETVTEGTILRWAKAVGDSIAEDEVLVEISTDKVDTEVPSPAGGVVLEILVEEGDTVEVGTALAVIGEAGESSGEAPAAAPEEAEQPAPATDVAAPEKETAPEPAAAETPAPAPEPTAPETPAPAAEAPAAESAPAAEAPAADSAPAPAPAPAPEPAAAPAAPRPTPAQETAPAASDGESRLLSPVVRKLARENNVDLAQVSGTGEGGRITRRDVESYIASGPAPAAQEAPAPAQAEAPSAPAEAPTEAPPPPAPTEAPAPAPAAPAPPAAAPAPAPAATAPPAPTAGEGDEEVPLDRLRVRIAENMLKAKQTAAHVWTSVEVDFERVERVRQAHKAAFKTEEGFSLTYLPFISRATIDALKAYPVVNSSFHLEERKSVMHRSVNLGIAVDLDQKGLIVAGVRDADGLRLVGLARQISELAAKARAGKLEPNDVTGATFTITNPGPFGSFMSAPVINVPNVGILSTDTITKRAAVLTGPDGEDMIAIRHIGYLGLTWDHRAFDGSTAVLFLQRIKHNLETWDWEQELT
jgi:2-oxoglutarate dehydrogenase E2 component (dihydrolipoamide succinyltransferase)